MMLKPKFVGRDSDTMWFVNRHLEDTAIMSTNLRYLIVGDHMPGKTTRPTPNGTYNLEHDLYRAETRSSGVSNAANNRMLERMNAHEHSWLPHLSSLYSRFAASNYTEAEHGDCGHQYGNNPTAKSPALSALKYLYTHLQTITVMNEHLAFDHE
jgi:hypothetical protein